MPLSDRSFFRDQDELLALDNSRIHLGGGVENGGRWGSGVMMLVERLWWMLNLDFISPSTSAFRTNSLIPLPGDLATDSSLFSSSLEIVLS